MKPLDIEKIVHAIAWPVFAYRRPLLALLLLVTLGLGYSATGLRVDAGFNKMIPLQHEYMKTFTDYRKTFGGANRVLVAVMQKDGDIYNPAFMATLKKVTDDLFFIPGVDRATVTSLFTPNVRFIEIIEEGFAGGNVIPAGFKATPEQLDAVRKNVIKSGNVGRLVSNDFKGAIVRAELLEIDPSSGQRLEYQSVAKKLEAIREAHQKNGIDIHIIGFAKAIGDITDGARGVLMFFLLAFVITAVLLYFYSGSGKLTVLALFCALVPVLWLLGTLPLIGYGIDPISILVPFLIFSIGVSHAVQMTNVWKHLVSYGDDSLSAARTAFIKLLKPGTVALLTNALGFMVIMHIKIDVVRELGITASLGVLLMIITNKILLPILLSYLTLDEATRKRTKLGGSRFDFLWLRLEKFAEVKNAKIILLLATALLVVGTWQARQMKTGDLGKGIPELHDNSRYNRDNTKIVDHFSIGVDVLSVVVQTQGINGACTDFTSMETIDRFELYLRNVQGVKSVLALPGVAKVIGAGWNEGSLKWRALSRDPTILAQAVTPVDTATGLLNTDCNAMQVLIFTGDHQGTTLAHVVKEVKKFAAEHNTPQLKFLLASGNAGVMAATNEAVEQAEFTMLLSIFGSIILLCLITFRSWRATLCIVVPLALVSILCNALMAILGIGIKVSTLPVIALGVGVGVDYGIYLFERIQHRMEYYGDTLKHAYFEALRQRGTAAIFTAITMGIGVATWGLSALKFQADMGILLAFLFLVNMLGALLLLPALAAMLIETKHSKATPRQEPAT